MRTQNHIYYKEKTFTREGTTIVIDATDYPMRPPPDYKCARPQCCVNERMHTTLKLDHAFELSSNLEPRGYKITLPKNVNVIAHGKSVPFEDHRGCRCFPTLDVTILNGTSNDDITIYGSSTRW